MEERGALSDSDKAESDGNDSLSLEEGQTPPCGQNGGNRDRDERDDWLVRLERKYEALLLWAKDVKEEHDDKHDKKKVGPLKGTGNQIQ